MPTNNELGVTFAPTFANADRARQGGGTPQGSIQTLNFRLPRVTGAASAHAISPLVGEERRGTSFGGAVLQSVLRTVLGAEQAAALMGRQDDGDDDGGAAILRSLAGGGTDTYAGWMDHERDLNARTPTLGQTPNPVFVPSQETGEGPRTPYQPPDGWIDPRPSLPERPVAPAPVPDFSGMSPWEREHGGWYGDTDPIRMDRDGNYL